MYQKKTKKTKTEPVWGDFLKELIKIQLHENERFARIDATCVNSIYIEFTLWNYFHKAT